MKQFTITIVITGENEQEAFTELKTCLALAPDFKYVKRHMQACYVDDFDEEELLGKKLTKEELQEFTEQMEAYIDEE